MLDQALKEQIQTTYRQFLSSRDLKPRYGQKMMIAEVARTLGGVETNSEGERSGDGHICMVEAGTGTGKTMAYLLSAIPIARKKAKSLVISTATVALQEQLISKDLPEATELMEFPVNYVLAKGRGRYFCISQAEKLLESQHELGQMALYEDEVAQRIDADDLAYYGELLNKFASGDWDGDRDSLPEEINEERWYPMTSDHTRCTNRRCQNFSVCPFFKSRDSMDKADIVVANHDLVLADLSLGGGAILPEPAQTIYLLDEAHHLGTKAKGHFSYSMRVKGSQRWLRSVNRQLKQLIDETDHYSVVEQYAVKMDSAMVEVERLLEQIDTYLRSTLIDGRDVKERYRFPKGVLPEAMMEFCKPLSHEAEKVMLKAEQIVDLLKEALDGGIPEITREVADRWYPRMGQLWSRAQSMYWLAKSYSIIEPQGAAPVARWINLHESGDGLDFECRSSPITAAETLDEHLWQVCFGAVLTSATMTALGTFQRISEDLGLPDKVSTQRLPSPFDYQSSAVLSVPRMLNDPSDPEAHTDEVADLLQKTLPDSKAALVLFSSWRQMMKVRDQLDGNWCRRILMQGDLTKNEIIKRHKSTIDDGTPSIIFGLASFAEGVDLPGKYLEEVIITKLPFGVPDDPVDATMAEWIEQRGGNAFMEWTVPEASVRLTQATGRLLRSEQDTGKILLLDRRIITKRYGRQLLDALPPYRREIG